ncbi:MAG: ribbon-helix-helix protein, CopG family [Gammaproteobacteria bacterium]|nr:MAG: ribbon-helix-helix protein, CopG family [Gammaproteobacteria bacterium]
MKKKEVVISVRIDSEISEIINALAKDDDRTVGWVARKLLTEALESRRNYHDEQNFKKLSKKN